MANKSSLENILKSALAVGNKEQNFGLPPDIYSSQYNTVTSFLLDKLSNSYPEGVDILLPFIKSIKIPVKDGKIQLPQDYRNLLGSPSISVKPDGSDCSGQNPIDTEAEFKKANLKSGCKTRGIQIVDKDEWDNRTTSTYAFPTTDDPIGMYVEDRKIKVCPHDLSNVEVTYVKKEKLYVFGYQMQPDDTYIYVASTSVESEWTDSAFSPLFRGVIALYAAYVKDNDLSNWSQVLNQAGII